MDQEIGNLRLALSILLVYIIALPIFSFIVLSPFIFAEPIEIAPSTTPIFDLVGRIILLCGIVGYIIYSIKRCFFDKLDKGDRSPNEYRDELIEMAKEMKVKETFDKKPVLIGVIFLNSELKKHEQN
ncbi:MAG: hypothetical protein ACTSYI_11015 [Promethearchaeota archaeon]